MSVQNIDQNHQTSTCMMLLRSMKAFAWGVLVTVLMSSLTIGNEQREREELDGETTFEFTHFSDLEAEEPSEIPPLHWTSHRTPNSTRLKINSSQKEVWQPNLALIHDTHPSSIYLFFGDLPPPC